MGKAFLPCLVSITSPSSLANLDMPKSAILHSLLWSTRTFLAARSRWMICAKKQREPSYTDERPGRSRGACSITCAIAHCPHDGELHAITSSAQRVSRVVPRKTQPWVRARDKTGFAVEERTVWAKTNIVSATAESRECSVDPINLAMSIRRYVYAQLLESKDIREE